VYIFGHNMYKANLMDMLIPEDVFNVELVDTLSTKKFFFNYNSLGLMTHCLVLTLLIVLIFYGA
jgi:hypothetical protein